MRNMLMSLFLMLLAHPLHASVEVSDSVVSIEDMWIMAILYGTLSFWLAFKNVYLIAIGFIIMVLFSYSYYDIMADKQLFSAVLNEHGEQYFIHVVLSCGLMFILPIAGATISTFKKRSKTKDL